MKYTLLEDYKKGLILSSLQKEVLVGLLLGDGHLELSLNRKSARLKVEYCVRNSDYVEFLYKIFKNLVKMKPRTRIRKSFGKNFTRIGFSTLFLLDFLSFRDLFYRGKTKIVPSNISKLLTDIGLAVWFMDDGSYKSRQCRGKLICTHHFANEEISLLCNALKEKFALDTIPRKQVDGTEIYIRASSFSRLKELIFPYIVPSFKYKLDSVS